MGSFAGEERSEGQRVNKWLKIATDIPVVIIIMDDKSLTVYKHWITDSSGRKVGLRCLGRNDCPICIRNMEINYNREHPDFVRSQKRYRINVLEVTPVKACPNCEAVYPSGAVRCTTDGCAADLASVEAKPLCQVKILERGKTLMQQFDALAESPHFSTDEVLPIQSYPIKLVATGAGRNMTITVLPQMLMDVDLSKYEKYDLDSDLLLTSDEITSLLGGTLYRDILAARRAMTETRGAFAEARTEEMAKDKEIPF